MEGFLDDEILTEPYVLVPRRLEVTVWAFKNMAFAGVFRMAHNRRFDHAFNAASENESDSRRVVNVGEIEQGSREAPLSFVRSFVKFARARKRIE
jgi:hypothetical protein